MKLGEAIIRLYCPKYGGFGCDYGVVCKIRLLARRTRPKGRPSAARDDRVSCIQIMGVKKADFLIT